MTTVDEWDPSTVPAPAPLTPLLRDAAVSWEVFDWRYGPLPRLVDTVLGVVPNCDR
jgi:hypothetical protein